MRRKCFFLLIIILAGLHILDFLAIPLTKGMDDSLYEGSISFTGKVISLQQKSDCLRLTVKLEMADGISLREKENVLLSYYVEEERPWELLNSRITFDAQLQHPRRSSNPHCFDYAKYLKSRRIGAVASVKVIRKEQGRLSYKERYERILCKKKYLFCRSLSEESRGIVMGILFGDTAFLDEDAYDDFRKNGTAHILAVSGLHVGLIYGIYQKLTSKKNSIASISALAFILYTYGELSGWSPSVSRAILMIALSVLARAADLRYDTLTAMSTAAFILIINNPYVVFGTGFQMSFLAICSIAFIRPIIPVRIPEGAAAMLSVYIGLLPYQIYQFNFVSLTALIANIPLVYLAGYFLPLAAAGFIAFSFLGTANLAGDIIDAMGRLVFFVNKLTSLDGWGGFDVISPPAALVFAVTIFVFFLSSEAFAVMKLRLQKKRIAGSCVLILTAAVIFQIFTFCSVSDDNIIFVDVGQGDCIHIRTGRTDILIDGGGNMNYNIGKKTLKPYLLKNGAWDVDLAIATHEHMDHMKGLTELGEVYSIKKLLTGLTAGVEIDINKDVRIQTLWPEEISEDTGQDENSQCSVFMVFYKEYKILVTGDLDEKGEKLMLQKYEGTEALKADIMKIGHHGSTTSTSDAFLDAVKPTYAVIQTGKNNYGHPSPKIIEKCEKKGIMVYRNDYNGAVGFTFDKRGISCNTVL